MPCRAIGLLVACAFFITKPILDGRAHEYLELAGFGLAILCVAGRAWSILYVGAHKNRRLVMAGPYSMTRNPLYLFSTIGAAGIGLIFGSLVAAAILGLVSYLVLARMAQKEAAHLRTLFGAQYDAYARQTPFFWPRPLALFRSGGSDVLDRGAEAHRDRRACILVGLPTSGRHRIFAGWRRAPCPSPRVLTIPKLYAC